MTDEDLKFGKQRLLRESLLCCVLYILVICLIFVVLQFERFLPPDAMVVASVYAPIMFSPAGVLMFRHTTDGGEWSYWM